MSGETNLNSLLTNINPVLHDEKFVFCCFDGDAFFATGIKPKALFYEEEGLTVVLTDKQAKQLGHDTTSTFSMLTLQVHSSLEAVGLTAAVSAALTNANISANVIAAYYHDHIFVPTNRAEEALKVLNELADKNNPKSI